MISQDRPRVEPHRGAAGDLRQFAASFVQARMEGFAKDMQICLTPVPSKTRSGPTHAYFPALMACCGTLEYLAGLFAGRTKPCGDEELSRYASKFLPQPEYGADSIHILHCALRHSVAHRGIATGVWVDRKPGANRRVTWRVSAETKAPSIVLKADEGSLTRDSPWPCRHTHRVHIRLGRLWRDIRESANAYCADLSTPKTFANFEACMRSLYPK